MDQIQLPGLSLSLVYADRAMAGLTGNLEGSRKRCDHSSSNQDIEQSLADTLTSKRRRLNQDAIDLIQNVSTNWHDHLQGLRHLLTCSVCLEEGNGCTIGSASGGLAVSSLDGKCIFNQCPNGHLICNTCCTRLEQASFAAGRLCTCPVCRSPLTQRAAGMGATTLTGTGLQRCLLAQRLAAWLPVQCRHCSEWMPVAQLYGRAGHERTKCPARPTICPFSWFGCEWQGSASDRLRHVTTRPAEKRASCSKTSRSRANPVSGCKFNNLATRRLLTKVLTTTGGWRQSGFCPSGIANVTRRSWRQLISLLETHQTRNFGSRYGAGLRLVPVHLVLTRVTKSGIEKDGKSSSSDETGGEVVFKSSAVCLPIRKKTSIWLQANVIIQPLPANRVRIAYNLNVGCGDRRSCLSVPTSIASAILVTSSESESGPSSSSLAFVNPVGTASVQTRVSLHYNLTRLSGLEMTDAWHEFKNPVSSLQTPTLGSNVVTSVSTIVTRSSSTLPLDKTQALPTSTENCHTVQPLSEFADCYEDIVSDEEEIKANAKNEKTRNDAGMTSLFNAPLDLSALSKRDCLSADMLLALSPNLFLAAPLQASSSRSNEAAAADTTIDDDDEADITEDNEVRFMLAIPQLNDRAATTARIAAAADTDSDDDDNDDTSEEEEEESEEETQEEEEDDDDDDDDNEDVERVVENVNAVESNVNQVETSVETEAVLITPSFETQLNMTEEELETANNIENIAIEQLSEQRENSNLNN